MNYLVHHGIPNQKWGERNGPPYPLSREEHNQVVRSGNIAKIKEHLAEFRDWEIEEALKKFNYNQKIEALEKNAITIKGREKYERFMSKATDAKRLLETTASAAEHGVRLYNVVANVVNTFCGKDWKTVPTSGKKSDDKHDNKNDDRNDKHSNDNHSTDNKKSIKDKIKNTLNKPVDVYKEKEKPEWKQEGFNSEEDYKRWKAKKAEYDKEMSNINDANTRYNTEMKKYYEDRKYSVNNKKHKRK